MTAITARPAAAEAGTGSRDGRLRLAFVYDALYPYVIGGGERRFHEIGRRLAARHDVHFVSWQFWDGPSRIERDGMTFHGIGRAPTLYGEDGKRTISEAAAFAVRALPTLLRNRFDVIDCSATPYVPLFGVAAVARLRRTPLVATWHEFWGEHWDAYLPHRPIVARLARLIEAASSRLGDVAVPVSDFTERRLRRRASQVVGNGVDLDEIRAAPSNAEPCDVLFAGRLIDEKRVDVLIEAVALVAAGRPEVSCTIVGGGPQLKALERLVAERGLDRNVRLVGRLASAAEVYGRMKAARMFVMPSVREGFGLAVVEAQACGAVPIVVRSADSAAVDLVDDGVDGVVCDPTPAGIAAAIERLMADEPLRLKMSANVRTGAERWSWDRLAGEIEGVYLSLARANVAREVSA